MDRLTSMSIFVKAVDLGSFSAAADALHMSPQLVGKHIQILERHMGVRLLNRTTRRQSLTDVGKSFYQRVRIILAEVEAVDSLVAETRSAPRGHLKINAPVTFAIHALAPRLHEYMGAYPEVSVDLTMGNHFVDMIEAGYDAVFRVGDLPDSGLIARPLAPYRLVACAAPSYLASHGPIRTPMDLRQHECLGFSHTELRTHWTFDGLEGRVSVPVSGRLMVNNGEALLPAAIAGLGVMLQPAELARAELESGRLVRVLAEYSIPTRPLHILYAPDRHLTPKLRSFIDFSIKTFGCEDSR